MSVLQSKRRAIINEPHKATSSGAVVTMDKAEYAPMNVVANFAPVQDLHGQTSPYPAGGGTNKWDEEWELGTFNTSTGANTASTTQIRSKNLIPVVGGETYYFVTSAPTGLGVWVMMYDADNNIITPPSKTGYTKASNCIQIGNGANSHTFTMPNDAVKIKFYCQSSYGATYNNDIAINYPSTVTTYSPYANICPISGWTGCNVYDDAKLGQLVDWNQIMPTAQKSGTFTVDSDTTSYGLHVYDNLNISTVIGHKYYVSAKITRTISDNDQLRIVLRKSGNTGLGGGAEVENGDPDGTYATIVTSAIDVIKSIEFNNYNGKKGFNAGDTMAYDECMLVDMTQIFGSGNEPTTVDEFKALFPKPYYPYNAGQQMTVGQVNGEAYRAVNVDWTDEAGTVYGGTFDVAKGVLTAKYRLINLGDYTWTKHSSGKFFYMAINTAKYQTGGSYLTNAKCTDYKATTPIGVTTTNMSFSIGTYHTAACNVYVRDERYLSGTATAFKTAMSGVYLCYELATPITYTLTPTQIKSLRGKNNVWTDMNGDTSATLYVH